jgi:rhamnosyltransferase
VNFTICIPTMNARPQWPELTAALRAQTMQPREVLVVDSESDDGTPALAAGEGYRVRSILRRDFRHGGTRQWMAEQCDAAEVLLYMTQDAIPFSERSVEELLAAFDNPEVAAAYGRQLPHKGAGAIATHARLFNYPARPEVRSRADIARLGFKTIFFSNSFGAYRRNELMAVGGFPKEVNFGEDTVVAARLILAGKKIAYAAEAGVYHSHDYSWRQEMARYGEVGRLHGDQSWLRENFGGADGEGLRFVLSEARYLARRAPGQLPATLVRTAAKLIGYRRGLGRARRVAS